MFFRGYVKLNFDIAPFYIGIVMKEAPRWRPLHNAALVSKNSWGGEKTLLGDKMTSGNC